MLAIRDLLVVTFGVLEAGSTHFEELFGSYFALAQLFTPSLPSVKASSWRRAKMDSYY